MKSEILYFLVALNFFPATSVVAQIAQTADEVNELLFVSNLKQIVASEGEKYDALGVESIRKILINHEMSLFGGIGDFSRFATLKDLCSKIEDHPDRKLLNDELFALFKKLPVLEGEPKNWNEVAVKSEGGALGLIAKCLLASSEEEMHLKVINYLVKSDEIPKTELLMEKARIIGKGEYFARSFSDNLNEAKSEKMEALIRGFAEKVSPK